MDKKFYLPALFFTTGVFMYSLYYLGAILSSMTISRNFIEFPRILAVMSILIGGIALYRSLEKN